MYLLCELDDENYTESRFRQFSEFEEAFDAALISCGQFSKNVIQIDIEDCRKRVSAHTEDGQFYVTEIKEIDVSDGGHLLIWHHAYDGVNFSILYFGTEEECLQRRRAEIQKIFDERDLSNGDNDDFDMENGKVVDTGEEWEVFSIVKIEVPVTTKPSTENIVTVEESDKNGTNDLVVRKNLSKFELQMRLSNYFPHIVAKFIISAAMYKQYWTDGNIVVVYLGLNKYLVAANANYTELIE